MHLYVFVFMLVRLLVNPFNKLLTNIVETIDDIEAVAVLVVLRSDLNSI